jgi:hypothetical protein
LRTVVDPILQLDWAIQNTPGKDLDALIVDAARRKLLAGLLTRMELFRPYKSDETWALIREAAAVKPRAVETPGTGLKKPAKGKVALTPDLFVRKTDELQDAFLERVKRTLSATVSLQGKEEPRHGVEKRRALAFLLFTLSRTRQPSRFTIDDAVLAELRQLGYPIPPPAQEKLQAVMGKTFEDEATFLAALDKEGVIQAFNKALPGKGPSYRALFREFAREPLYSASRAEVVSGIREFTRAAETFPLVLDRLYQDKLKAIQLDRGGERYTLDYHVRDPKLFTEKLVGLLKRAGVKELPEAFTKEVEARFTQLRGKLSSDEKEPATVKVWREVNNLLEKHGVEVADPKSPDAKLRQAEFVEAVLRLADPRSPGFLGRHRELIGVIRDLAARVREKQRRLEELAQQQKEVESSYYSVWSSHETARELYRQKVAAEVLALRGKTRALADEVTRLTREIFRAQVELANADRYNQALERYLRRLEQLPRNQNKRRPGK